jgi:hypothetical protein
MISTPVLVPKHFFIGQYGSITVELSSFRYCRSIGRHGNITHNMTRKKGCVTAEAKRILAAKEPQDRVNGGLAAGS